jgi:4'-phosphopantetheinyl transferase
LPLAWTACRAPVVHCITIDAVERLAGSGEDRERRLSCWLTLEEREIYAALRVPKRRREWLSGRLAAKEAVRRRHRLLGADAFTRIEILAVTSGRERGRPYYRVDGSSAASFGLSIAHSGGVAVATLATRLGERIGVDVEHPVEGGPGFESLLLGPCERRRLEDLPGPERRRALSRLWVLKEAFTKALGIGLRLPLSAIRVQGGVEAPSFLLPPGIEATLAPGTTQAEAFERDGVWFAWVSLAPEPRFW